MSGTEIYPTDEQGRIQCPDCKQWINGGPGGVKFLEKRHQGTKRCREDAAKLAVKGPRLKDASIMSFLRPGGPAPRVPSQTQAPAPVVLSPTKDLPPSAEGEGVASTFKSHLDDSNPSIPVVTFYKTPLANSFQALVDALPPSPPNATPDGKDPLSGFACDPALHDKQYINNEDLWEELLNPLLKSLLGWGDTLDVGAVVEGKRGGLMGVAPFIEYYVQRRKVNEGLFEGKLAYLMSEMANLCKTTQTIIEKSPNNDHILIPIPSSVAIPEVDDHGTLPPSPPIDVDTDQPVHAVLPETPKTKSEQTCAGYPLKFPPGLSPHSNYPFALHDTLSLPWNYTVFNSKMVLYSVSCTKNAGKRETACSPCRRLGGSTLLNTIRKRIEDVRVPDNIPYAYRSMLQLQATLKHKDSIINFLRLRGLNQAKTLLANSQSLSEYKRFVIAIASGKYANVSRLIRIGLNQNRSISAIARSYHAAAKGTYQPKTYTEEEDMIGLLLFKLGGSRVAGIAHRALGLPAVSTLRSRITMPPLIPSHALPTIADVIKNIQACMAGIRDIVHGQRVVHQIAMFDEIATEKRLRWDEKTNFFLGVCREHGSNTSLEFNSVEDMEELLGSLERKEVHWAAEVEV